MDDSTVVEIGDSLKPSVAKTAPRKTRGPKSLKLVMAERAWFELFWRGVAAHPAKPLPHDLFSVE